MKIAIVTQPLLNNYGGLLQNYALQKILKFFKHEPVTIDYIRITRPSLLKYLGAIVKSYLSFYHKKKRKIIRFSLRTLFYVGQRQSWSKTFITNITRSEKVYLYNGDMFENFDCVVVGSDQVWRPKFVYNIYNYFLDFINHRKIKRISYAASFGVDNWEYTPKQTLECSLLAKKFDAISVREESGVELCKEHLGVDATWVLDPTLLLTKEDYLPICREVSVCNEKYLAVYVLNENDEVTATYEKESIERGLAIRKFHADSKSTLTVPEWLAMFRDASFVVTDSFHGTVFSIIFGKDFKCIYNKSRGAARFESLLNLYNSGKLEEMREFSLNWLKEALES